MEIIIKAIKNSSGRYTCHIQQLEFIVFEANEDQILKKAKALVTMTLRYFLETAEAEKFKIKYEHVNICKNKVNGHCPLHNIYCNYPNCEKCEWLEEPPKN